MLQYCNKCMTEKQKKEKKSMNGRFLSVNRLYYSNKQFCSIFKILLFNSGYESNQIENKMHNLVQEYAYRAPYYA